MAMTKTFTCFLLLCIGEGPAAKMKLQVSVRQQTYDELRECYSQHYVRMQLCMSRPDLGFGVEAQLKSNMKSAFVLRSKQDVHQYSETCLIKNQTPYS